jgi:membrane protein implicated in regulation of membrane protease activity
MPDPKMTQPKFPWALLVILGMFGFVLFSQKTPPYFQVAAAIAVVVVSFAAFYQLISRRDESADWEKKTQAEADEVDPLEL